MSPEEWATIVGSEYLATFVRQGGAAVKFAAATTDAGRAELRQRLAAEAEAHGFQLAILDAAEVRLHLIDRLFHAVARQVDWDGLARAFLERLLRARGLRLPPASESLSALRLAELNAERLTARRPWLLVKPLGTTLWIGPVFRPGTTGCWECLAQRYLSRA